MADTLGVINHSPTTDEWRTRWAWSITPLRRTNGGHTGRDQSLPYDGRTADTLGVINHAPTMDERRTRRAWSITPWEGSDARAANTPGVINHAPTGWTISMMKVHY